VIKSLPPLLVALNPRSASSLLKLREHRQALSAQITDLINKLGPEVFPDFVPDHIAEDTSLTDTFQSRLKSMPPSRLESRGKSQASSPGFGSSLTAHNFNQSAHLSIETRNLGE
jgi:glycerol-3-phosphate O-acyltransferase/dihydroxyacetone phosphate acyltransferase